MSFSSDEKQEIIKTPIKSVCCRRAFLQGIIAARGEPSPEKITLSLESREYCEYVSSFISEVYGKTAEISSSPKGGRRKLLSFYSPAAIKYLNGFFEGEIDFSQKCSSCQTHFLRGIFFSSGRVSDPKKQYCLEFSSRFSIDRLFKIFENCMLSPRISKKAHETLIYFKNSGQIEDFFALAGMNNAAFSFMNAKIHGEIRNNANRVANCETNNIDKAVSASLSQIGLIEALERRGLISQLPDDLEKTARLRMEHKDLSLSQLALLFTPKISKPGLSHRLKKITEIAASLLDSGNKNKK